jgi:hypothetical protein
LFEDSTRRAGHRGTLVDAVVGHKRRRCEPADVGGGGEHYGPDLTSAVEGVTTPALAADGGSRAMHYLAIGRYNAQGAAGILKDGLSSRKEVLRGFAEATGARLVGMWGVEESSLDFVILLEGDFSPAVNAATSLGQMSMGHLADVQSYTLIETEEIDDALQRVNTVTRAPGE